MAVVKYCGIVVIITVNLWRESGSPSFHLGAFLISIVYEAIMEIELYESARFDVNKLNEIRAQVIKKSLSSHGDLFVARSEYRRHHWVCSTSSAARRGAAGKKQKEKNQKNLPDAPCPFQVELRRVRKSEGTGWRLTCCNLVHTCHVSFRQQRYYAANVVPGCRPWFVH